MRAATLSTSPIPSQRLSYNPKTKTFAAEESSIREFDAPARRRVQVRSQRTGLVETFDYVRTEKDVEGDVLFWEFRNASYGLKLVIFND